MDQLFAILRQYESALTRTILVLSVGLVVFTLLERIFQFMHVQKSWRAYLLDLQYAFLSMLYPPFLYFILSALFASLSLQTQGGPHNPKLSPWVFAGQFLAVLFARDCLIYLRHRIFHTRPVWAFHSIHHASEEVNWLSAARFHPFENMLEAGGEILLLLICQANGFDALVLSVSSLTVGFYNFFIHSNLRWTFGPLRYVLVSPVFHRWHHSDQPAAQDKNFAAMFSCLDLMFGTFYMPREAKPETTGLSPEEKPAHPRTLAGQLMYPFRKR